MKIPSPRAVLFRLHWALGLTAGLVLALMGATGALLSYEDALTAWANRDLATIAPREAPRLSPETLIARVQAQMPGQRVDALFVTLDPSASVRARFARGPGSGVRPTSVHADPYDGTVLGTTRWEAGFATVRTLHCWLLIPGDGRGWGRAVTGASTLALLTFLVTGLYLRWPRIHRWRIWFKPSLSRPGRARWWSLHAVMGTWLLPIYLVIALSGLTWSYDWIRDASNWLLAGQVRPKEMGARRGAEAVEVPPALDRAWSAFQAGEGREATLGRLLVPGRGADPIRVRWLARGENPSVHNEAIFSATTGALLASERAADMTLGRQIAANMLEVHRGRFFGGAVALLFCLGALVMPGFAATGIALYALRRRVRRSGPRR